MNRPDHSTYREWLNLDADGLLGSKERTLLEEHLASCPGCRREQEELAALEGLLRGSAVPVRSGFRDTVMASLQPAGWEARAPRAWGFPAAVIVLLGGLAAAFMVTGSASEPSGVSALLAVGSLLQAALLAGAGLLTASWKGMGLLFEEVISSPVSLGAFGFLVLCLNLLLISLVRRRRPARAAAQSKIKDFEPD
ncbi:MAG TPA: zf-HC2 domain-containing protein [Thermoanaerobaculia bacterium]|jgi:predicted anti-sigma-YlaC factor YlaD|nr:zf-HC2 domain-containing protein [Thermoanaerobaculia bacterium]